ncbi:MAG: tRNA (guanosine(46)-N7)-methyltransferase TrmB [Planctomycetota bacterium]|jgi:tRNA (guanine-N7-)-methyltransferase
MAKTLKDYPLVSIAPEDLNDTIDFERIFGRPCPVHIEIGTGKAAFLLSQARAMPDVNFLGIEWSNKFYRYAVDRIGRWSLTNVKIIRTDAAPFIAEAIPASTIDCFHIYFPDPWPKRRHHKRRFFRHINLDHLIRCLKPAGRIQIVTDHRQYFQQIQSVFSQRPSRLKEVSFIPAAGAAPGQLTAANYEKKYIKQNRPIYSVAVIKE